VVPGKPEWRKPIALIYAAHNPAYCATASAFHFSDYMMKVRRGMEADGPAVIHVMSPCHRSWRYPEELGMQMAKLAVDTCYHPLWEYDGATRTFSLSTPSKVIAQKPERKLPIEKWLEPQGRFAHLFRPTRRDDLLADFQRQTDEDWAYILKLTGIG
jgi:pyruvate ferredoxin oxidoreductase beta subunit